MASKEQHDPSEEDWIVVVQEGTNEEDSSSRDDVEQPSDPLDLGIVVVNADGSMLDDNNNDWRGVYHQASAEKVLSTVTEKTNDVLGDTDENETFVDDLIDEMLSPYELRAPSSPFMRGKQPFSLASSSSSRRHYQIGRAAALDTQSRTTAASDLTDDIANADLVDDNRPHNNNNHHRPSPRRMKVPSLVVASSHVDHDDSDDLNYKSSPGRSRCCIVIAVLFFLFLLAGTVVAVLQIMRAFNEPNDELTSQNEPVNNNNDDEWSIPPFVPTASPAPAATTTDDDYYYHPSHEQRVQVLLEVTLSAMPHMEIPPFNETTTPSQARAYKWLQRDLGSVDISDARLLQRYALAVLFFETRGPKRWFTKRNWLSKKHECQWFGVDQEFCTDDGLITWLVLAGNGLKGRRIPNELALLENLRFLELSNNEWEGSTIPSVVLSHLTRLEMLSISNGDLSGPLPTELGLLKELTVLFLDSNDLTGTIPDELFDGATSLVNLAVSYNDLHGPLSTKIGQLQDLSLVSLEENDLSGTIPIEIGNLRLLRGVHMGDNDFVGPIPSELGNLQKATRLVLRHNDLTGTIPTELGEMLSIEVLRLDGNEGLDGSIPTEFASLSHANLRKLDVSDSQVDPVVPTLCDALPNTIFGHAQIRLVVPCHGKPIESVLAMCNCCTSCWDGHHDDDDAGRFHFDDDEYVADGHYDEEDDEDEEDDGSLDN